MFALTTDLPSEADEDYSVDSEMAPSTPDFSPIGDTMDVDQDSMYCN